MKGKWHINAKGIPSLCKAEKRPCPLGNHYNTKEEAVAIIETEFENDYGLLPKEDDILRKRKDLSELIQRISGVKLNGFDYECFASISLAESLGLDKVAISDQNGLIVNLNIGESTSSLNADVYVERSIKGLSNYYKKLGIPIKDESLLARVIYYSDDIDKGILVQSGGPNVLDAAIIKADEVVDIIEVKELERGAQLPLVSIDVNSDGSMKEEALEHQSPTIKKALLGINMSDIDGKNLKLDFGSEMANKRDPLYYFLNEYKKKGATSFIYTTENGNKLNRVDLTGPEDEVVEDMLNRGIEANVILRGNLHKQNASEEDIERFNTLVNKEYSKSGRSSMSESFTLKSIKKEKLSKSGDYLRIGSFILPIKHEDYEKSINKRIKKKDLKSFKFSLTGNIKTKY